MLNLAPITYNDLHYTHPALKPAKVLKNELMQSCDCTNPRHHKTENGIPSAHTIDANLAKEMSTTLLELAKLDQFAAGGNCSAMARANALFEQTAGGQAGSA